MIKHLSEKTARYVVQNDETADFEVLAYGYELIYQEIAVILITLLLALPFGLFFHVLVGTVSFHLLRRYAGGSHANSRVVCTIVSTLILYGPSFVFGLLNVRLPGYVCLALFCIDVTLLALYAPADSETKPIQTKSKRTYMKIASLIVVTVLFIIAWLLVGIIPEITFVIMSTATIVCLFTSPVVYMLLGCKKSI